MLESRVARDCNYIHHGSESVFWIAMFLNFQQLLVPYHDLTSRIRKFPYVLRC